MNFRQVELIPVLHRNVNIGDAGMEPSLLSFWRDRKDQPRPSYEVDCVAVTLSS